MKTQVTRSQVSLYRVKQCLAKKRRALVYETAGEKADDFSQSLSVKLIMVKLEAIDFDEAA